ncbi:hypothetical protein MYP_4055 [Sporocytophaga myxococcoides]|uniref:Fibronectin type-III domain-containing protein n=1 Tax=Sporocytophaga myxococcoides TaxID=153721 RepID=A0A098LIQ6_9BACT|nr:hypothetical protein [Sporocytophaga myxococcoides]GAL86825.1 hypothetical protein MYP_4055 [Sporocytophaga myxococcoides]
MKRFLRFYFIAFLIIATGKNVFAQTYPVTVNSQLIPPYSLYLSDYANPENEKLFVSLLFNDANISTYNVKLQLTIEGVGIKIQSKPDGYYPAIALTSGMMERLSGADLAPYFDPNNLIFQGITKEQYQKNASLPEGIYKFSIQVFDYERNKLISNKSISQAWIVLNDPPRIVTPTCQSLIKVLYPQNIVFQWLPMHLTSPNASFTTEYHFRLVQIMPIGRNPNDAMLSSPPIFEAVTDNSTLYYGISETQLIPGQQYAWRVQAKDKGGKDLFKNNGYSEVCMFTYGDPCKPPVNIKAEVQSPQTAKINWDQMFGPQSFIVRYREKGTSTWYKNEAFQNSSDIKGLTANKQYEYQIQSACDPIESEFSPIDTFSTKVTSTFQDCGVSVNKPTVDNTTNLELLFPNDVLLVDGFQVRVTSANGTNGIFSGTGVAYIPFLNTYILTAFNSISVNKKYEVYKGKIVSVKANIDKYRSMAPTPPLKKDICQETPDNKVTENKNSGKNNKANEKASPSAKSDSVFVIILNGNIQVKEGDTITVNGKQVIVTKDTQIKEGDTVVANGKTINVNSVQSKNVATSPSVPQEFKLILQEILVAIREEKYDSLVKLKKVFLSNLNQFKKLNENTVIEFGTGNKATLDYDTSSAKSFKPLRVKSNSTLSSEQNEFIKQRKLLLSLYGTIAAANEILRKENIEAFSADAYESVKNKDKPSDKELKKIIEPLIIKYKEENFNK